MTGRPAVALTALLAGPAVVMAIWLSIDRRPPEWDHANHLERAVLCQRSLGEPPREALQEIIAESSFYPPIVTCAAGLLGFALPPRAAAHAVMWAALVLGTLAIFGLGRRLLDPAAGLLAAFLFATAPFVVFSLMNFQLDLPLAAMVALALYSLARTEALSDWRWSLGLGAVMGLGMLTKPPVRRLRIRRAPVGGVAGGPRPRPSRPPGPPLPGPDLRARLGVDAGPEPAPFTLRADGVTYGGVRLPALLVHWIVRNFDPTPRLRRLPMAVSVAPISVGAGRLEVGTDPDPLCPPKESR